MGVKSYVAGLQSEAVSSATGLATQGLNLAQRLKSAKDTADVNREKLSIEGKANEFLTNLERDRDWQRYPEKLEEAFSSITAGIDDNDLLSSAARRQLKEEILPLYKEQARQSVSSLQSKSQLAEVQVEVDGYGSVLTNNEKLSVEEASTKYREHLTELGLWNEYTVSKKVEDYEYGMVPAKAVQSLMQDYEKIYTQGDAGFTEALNVKAAEFGLDATQRSEYVKTANAQRKVMSEAIEAQWDSQVEQLRSDIAASYDQGEIYPAEAIDSLIDSASPKYRNILYGEKTKVYNNNDNILEGYFTTQISEGAYIGPDGIAALKAIKDPKRRADVTSQVIAHNATAPKRGADYAPKAFSERLASVESSEIPATSSEKAKAKSYMTIEELGRVPSYDDVLKVVDELFISEASTAPAEEATPATSEEGEDPAPEKDKTPKEVPELTREQSSVLGRLITNWQKDNPGKTPTASEISKTGVNFVTDETVQQVLEAREAEPMITATASETSATQEQETSVAPEVTEDPDAVVDTSDMDEIELAAHLIYNAIHGNPISESDFNRIGNPVFSELLRDIIIGQKTIDRVDDPMTLDYVNEIRMNANIRPETYERILYEGVTAGLITQETADKMGRPFYVSNPNFATVKEMVGEAYTDYKDYISNADDFRSDLMEAIDRSIMMNPDLIGDDFGTLKNIITNHVTNMMAGSVLHDLEKQVKKVSVTEKEVENMRAKDLKSVDDEGFQFFLAEVKDGKYDMFLRKDILMNPDPDKNMKMSRNLKQGDLLNVVAKSISGISWDEINETGSQVDKMEILTTANFIAAGGLLEKAMYGSLGVEPKDMIIIKGQWAFSDPVHEGVYFIPQFTDSVSSEGLGWAMVHWKNGAPQSEMVTISKYIDPALQYEYKELKAELADPLFKKNAEQVKKNAESLPQYTNQREYYLRGSQEPTGDTRNRYGDYYASQQEEAKKELPEVDPYKYKYDRLAELEKKIEAAKKDVVDNRAALLGITLSRQYTRSLR